MRTCGLSQGSDFEKEVGKLFQAAPPAGLDPAGLESLGFLSHFVSDTF